MSKSDRCTGHCCMAFRLPLSPKELAAKAAEPKPDMRRVPPGRRARDRALYADVQTIADMVVYLGEHPRNPVALTNQPGESRVGVDGKVAIAHWYTCIYFDGDTRNCTIHRERPYMCRDFPYGRPCEFRACTWKSGPKRTGKSSVPRDTTPTTLPPFLVQLKSKRVTTT